MVTKLDVLDEFETIPVCVGYRAGGHEMREMPAAGVADGAGGTRLRMPAGMEGSTFGMASYDDLPAAAKEYVAFLEQRTGVEVGSISTGPERNQTILRRGSKLEKLLK